MPSNGSLKLPIIGPPYLHCLVSSRAGQPLTIRAKLHTRDCLGVTNKSKLEAVVRSHAWCSLTRIISNRHFKTDRTKQLKSVGLK